MDIFLTIMIFILSVCAIYGATLTLLSLQIREYILALTCSVMVAICLWTIYISITWKTIL